MSNSKYSGGIYKCKKCLDRNWLTECKCGCGNILFTRDKYGVFREFKSCHAIKLRDQSGEKNSQWHGGKYLRKSEKRWYTRVPDHPNNKNGYVGDHRLVMEHYLKIFFDEDIYIPSYVDVHHINENTLDNSFKNLEMLYKKDHVITHNKVDDSDRICSDCGSNTTLIRKDGRREWAKDGKGGWLCNSCKCKRYRKENK